jgi:hypothetical protein
VSVQDLRVKPESQDTSAFYLASIYQVLADPNVTAPRPSVLSTVATPPPFSPPRYAVWVNSLWFLSLVISFTCALLAMMLRQWAYRYTRLTQRARHRPQERALIRAYFADGVDKMHLRGAVEILPALIHIYLFLFFAGLAIFLFNINHSVFVSVIWWIGLALMVYVWVTVMPVFWHHSPCYAPLSSLVWSLHAFLTYALYRVLAFITSCFGSPCQWTSIPFYDSSRHYRGRMVTGMWKTAEEIALKPSRDVDWRIWMWTISRYRVRAGYSLRQFFDAVPGFLKYLRRIPGIDTNTWPSSELQNALDGFLRDTLSSDLAPEWEKNHQLEFYLKIMDSIFEPLEVSRALSDILRGVFGELPRSIETAESLARWYSGNNSCIALAVQCSVASILQAVPQHDDRWIELASNRLDIPRFVLANYIGHVDNSVRLAISIQMTWRVFHSPDPPDPNILLSLSKFDICDTDSETELQHYFCHLWNEIVREARGTHSFHYVRVLRSIRQLYIALHQGTDAAPTAFDDSTEHLDDILREPSSYPLCNIDTHRPHRPPHPAILRIGGSTDPQQPEEANIFSGLPSSADDTPSHPQGSPSRLSTIDSVYVPP